MKKIIFLLIAFAIFASLSCSKKYEELQQNPNISTAVPPNLILNRLLNSLSGGLGGVHPWGSVHRYNQFYCQNYQYYGDNQYNWNNGPFDVYVSIIKNEVQMEKEAERSSGHSSTPYHAIGKFLKAFYFYNLSSMMGDIPLSEAVNAEILQPKYDSQKDVFLQILKWLDEANTEFEALKTNNDQTLKGDFYFNNDFTKWRKLVNTFKIRILIALSKKINDADLKVKQRLTDVLGNPTSYPIFESMSDNFAYRFIANVNNYSTNPVTYGFDALRYNMAQTYVKGCTDINDPRVLVTCEPAWKIVNDNGWAPTDFRAYIASPTGEAQDIMESKALSYQICHVNRYRYYSTFTAEDLILVGYPELCFNMAEAINRGWVTGDAEQWYKKGIQASQNFYGIKEGSNTGHYLNIGKSLGDWTLSNFNFSFNTYYNQTGVIYETGNAGLEKILKQKYLAFFQNSGWEAYYNYRRTGFPVFSEGVGIGNNGKIPKRWTYPASESNRNPENLKAALDSQFAGQNDINGEMWLIK